MASDDAVLMEASLTAAGGVTAEFRQAVFDRFFAAWPERRPTFLNLEASSIRMTEETVEMMVGLAKGEAWVWPLVAELVFTHRSYGRLPWDEYESWMVCTVDEIAGRAGAAWSEATDAAWRHHARQLLDQILEARTDWEDLLPPGYVGELG